MSGYVFLADSDFARYDFGNKGLAIFLEKIDFVLLKVQ